MKERSNNKDKITKTGDLSQKTIQKLRNSKDANKKDKRSYKETVQQEKTKLSRTKARKQHIVKS